MSFLRSRATIVIGLTLLVVSMLGGSLGIAMANQRNSPLVPGFNLIGGPLFADMNPDDFMSCLPDGSWQAIYIWNAQSQTWQHYFNSGGSLPSYVNHADAGGIEKIPQLAGVVIIMNTGVATPFVPDASSQVGNCP
jgi:hypothetical protein